MKRILSLFLPAVLGAPAAHARPLAVAAAAKAKSLQAGCIVTAERIGDTLNFALAGEGPEAGDTPPEKLVFEIGSVTKVFTGLLLAQAVVEKKTTLKTTVAEVLGKEAKFADPHVGAITLEQLSTHTSGLPRLATNAAAGMVKGDPYANYDEKLLLAYIQGATLEGTAPHALSYSNVGAGLLGYLLGRIYDTSWEEAVLAKICAPLGLEDTCVKPRKDHVVAAPHSGGETVKPWYFEALGGAGALRSTAADMMKFGEAMLHPEKTPLKEAFAIAMQPHAKAPANGGHIGLGVFMNKLEDDMTFHHDGGTGGYRSGLQVIPARGIVRVALINNDSLGGSEVIAATSETKARSYQEITPSPQRMAQYPGMYELDHDTRFTVVLHEEKLWLRLTGQAFLQASAMAPDRFFNKAVAAEVTFNRKDKDKNGAVESLTLFQNGRELTAKRTGGPPQVTLRNAQELQPYAGDYTLVGMKKLSLTVRANTLFAQLEGQEAMPVFETAPDHFEYDVVKAALVFTRDEKKNITGLVLQQNGAALPAPRVKNPPRGGLK